MGINNYSKLLLKLYDDKAEQYKWVHLCYIPDKLFHQYKENKPEAFGNMNKTLARWVKEDFDRDMFVVTAVELEILKNLVKEQCKEMYPEIFIADQNTDRQGWLRVWVTRKMTEDLEAKNDGE